jgi:hypothetical protein
LLAAILLDAAHFKVEKEIKKMKNYKLKFTIYGLKERKSNKLENTKFWD